MNRALYHTGQLADNMFAFPQYFKTEALITTDKTNFAVPLDISDLMFEMGDINSAQQWAYEALSINGETPRILKRLALIHILKNEYPIARKHLLLLSKTIFHKKWALHYLELLENPDLIDRDKNIIQIRSVMVKSDFLIRLGFPRPELASFLESTKKSKMAFEYLMAYDLLSCSLEHFIDQLEYLKVFNYVDIPRHYEEAIILLTAASGKETFRLPGFRFRQKTIDDFGEFMQILSTYNNDKILARRDLGKFANTYWYYFLYNN